MPIYPLKRPEATSRLAFVPAHLAVVAGAIVALACGWVPWFVVPVLSLIVGVSSRR